MKDTVDLSNYKLSFSERKCLHIVYTESYYQVMGDATIIQDDSVNIPIHIFSETLPRRDKVSTTPLQNIWLLCSRNSHF